MKPTLVVMLKEPQAGRVKTRLGRDIGMTASAWWFRHQAQSLLRRIESSRWDVVLAVSPDRAGMESRVWPAHLPRLPQRHGDLGDRMARVFRVLPKGPVCVIGADIPGIQPAHMKAAFDVLGSKDAVFGPAFDGGYWLVGLNTRRPIPPRFMQGVRWSSEHALTDTVATLEGRSIGYVTRLRDVDTAADLPR